MPNLTDTLNGEDKATIETLCTNICLRLDGSNSIDVADGGGGTGGDLYIPFVVDDVYEAGLKWTDDLAQTWTNVVQRGVGYSIFYNANQKLHITPDALQLESDINGLSLDGHPLILTDTSTATGADTILNIVSLTGAEYTAATKVATTLYIVTDGGGAIYLGTTLIA